MKLNILFAILFTSSAVAHVAANEIINAGKISFVGQFVNPACGLNTSEYSTAIDLGNLKESELSQVGSRSKSIPFKFKISTCEQENASATNISLRSLESYPNKNLLGITNPNQKNSAKNIAIEILDEKSRVLDLNGQSSLLPLDVRNDGVLNFSARYVATGKISTGKVMTAAIMQIEHH